MRRKTSVRAVLRRNTATNHLVSIGDEMICDGRPRRMAPGAAAS
ncbi:hypothetical protein L505_3511 [Bordetella bronchiseptica F4563]|nr:hypothetical protein L507_3351 [Bordetella bronchiseptica CA90 BB02]KDC29408.1 hypothetical protein L505_3511 [Bordetella bronchiseptica F4563]KDD19488.1 hypothetical protein L522_3444 [Bordetella bronchiseptica MBORD707]